MATVYRVTRYRQVYENGRTPADGEPDEVDVDTRWFTAGAVQISDGTRVATLETVLRKPGGHPTTAQISTLTSTYREAGVWRYEVARIEEGPKTLTYQYTFDVRP